MSPTETIAAGKALSELGVTALLAVALVAMICVVIYLWRKLDGVRASSGDTYIGLLKEGYADSKQRTDQNRDIVTAIDTNARETRDLRLEIAGLRSDIQRLRP